MHRWGPYKWQRQLHWQGPMLINQHTKKASKQDCKTKLCTDYTVNERLTTQSSIIHKGNECTLSVLVTQTYLWVTSPYGRAEEGAVCQTTHSQESYIRYLQLLTEAKLQLWSSNKSNFMVGGVTTTQGTVELKVFSIMLQSRAAMRKKWHLNLHTPHQQHVKYPSCSI